MKYKLIVRPEAEDDLSEAFMWYESKREGLGFDFLLQIDAGFRFIERNPLVFAEKYKGTRNHFIKRFPYKVVYCVKGFRVTVLAVIYGGRDPKWIKKKIDNI